jgi:hypothetical protein
MNVPATSLEWGCDNRSGPFLRPSGQTSRVSLVAVAFVRKNELLRIVLGDYIKILASILLRTLFSGARQLEERETLGILISCKASDLPFCLRYPAN